MEQFKGVVQRGSGAAGKDGFPTVNIPLADGSVSGIFAGIVALPDGSRHRSAVYADQKRHVLEAHLLDFSGDLYGKEITIELLKKIRDDKLFTSEEDLKKAIASDIENARAFFKS